MSVTVLSNQPPGGRCTLYRQYAETIGERFDLNIEVVYPDKQRDNGNGPPTLLIRGHAVMPSDGVIVSPEDVCRALQEKGFGGDLRGLQATLDRIQEDLFGE